MKSKSKKVCYTFMAMILALGMTGCGTPLHEMTDDEENVIVHYAAYAVAKYNVYQKDGMVAVEPQEDTEQADTEQTDKNKSDTASESTTEEKSDKNSEKKDNIEKVSLAEAVGQEALQVKYNGLEVADTYQEGRVYSLEAGAGSTYAILKFTLSNPTDKALDVKAFNNGHTYSASFGDGEPYDAENTFLTYSLSTYDGVIEAGESVDVVLLFEIPESVQATSDNVSLKVKMNNKNYLAEL